jgi:hypothetical protein
VLEKPAAGGRRGREGGRQLSCSSAKEMPASGAKRDGERSAVEKAVTEAERRVERGRGELSRCYDEVNFFFFY